MVQALKLLQELNEQIPTQQLAKQLVKECSLFMGNPTEVFRGVQAQHRSDTIQKLDIRQDRRPLDSDKLSSAVFNYLLDKHLGIPNIRTRALFCTKSMSNAKTYGELNWVFPINESIIVTSPKYRDSISIIDAIHGDLGMCFGIMECSDLIKEAGIELHKQEIVDFILTECDHPAVKDMQFVLDKFSADIGSYITATPDALASLPSNRELMLVSKSHYLIPMTWAQTLPQSEESEFTRVIANLNKIGNLTIQ